MTITITVRLEKKYVEKTLKKYIDLTKRKINDKNKNNNDIHRDAQQCN